MGEGRRSDTGRLPRGSPCGGVHLTDRCPDTKREHRLLNHRYHRNPVEEGDGYTELTPNDVSPVA